MKKTYQRPYAKVVEMDAQSIICASAKQGTFNPSDASMKVKQGNDNVWNTTNLDW